MTLPREVDTNSELGGVSFPVGSTANILHSNSIPHCSAFQCSGTPDYNESFLFTALLGYLTEIWLASAAREQSTSIDDAVSFPSVTSLAITKPDLKALFLDFDAPPLGGFSEGTVRPSGDYGYCQFLYDDGAAPLIHISFQHQKLVPPRSGCTGANLWFREKLSGSYVVQYNGTSPPQFVCDGSKPVSPSSNVMTGLGDFGTGESVENFQSNIFGTFQFPSTGAAWVNNPMNYFAVADNTTSFGDGIFYSLITAYLIESWQALVQPLFGTAGGPYPVSAGDNVYPPVLAFAKSGSLVVTPPTPAREQLVWRCGIPIYGAWAPVYGDYTGILKPLNLKTSSLVPDSNGCNGFWIFLKQGCTGALSTSEADNELQGTSNPNGNIILAQGQITGLTWAT